MISQSCPPGDSLGTEIELRDPVRLSMNTAYRPWGACWVGRQLRTLPGLAPAGPKPGYPKGYTPNTRQWASQDQGAEISNQTVVPAAEARRGEGREEAFAQNTLHSLSSQLTFGSSG